MTISPRRTPGPIPGGGRPRAAARIALAAGLAVALTATGQSMAAATQAAEGDPEPHRPKAGADKLGANDAELLAEAQAAGDKNVTLLVAVEPGETTEVADTFRGVRGASVGRTHDKLGYVRATVPTGRADAAIDKAAKLSSVHGIDLNEEIELPDPRPVADRAKGDKGSTGSGAQGAYPGPDRSTPRKNPYQPAHETGAVDFVRQHPKADGRGITIGILDSGVDLDHPALRRTTTGKRKITDWVTATDPIVDRDATWRPMVTDVSGPSFVYRDREYTAPRGDYSVSIFSENATLGGEMQGDLNRDGDTTDSWALLYDAQAGTVRVDLGDDGNFRNDRPMAPYGEDHKFSYFGADDPATAIAEAIPFVVEIRRDVPMDPYGGDWIGKKEDFVNIGVVEGAHGTHVAGITAANGLFGGRMDGAAPGAKIVSSRACTWSGGCTAVALTEGMIDLVANRDVDIVNMSIGGLPPLNDGNNARTELYNRLIDTYGVQLVISAGNSGPGANTIGDPGLADKVISVGAGVSRGTWAANYGSRVTKKYQMMPFSSRGPREDGGATPTITAPGASINTIPTWQAGAPVPEAGYDLPPGYGMLQGTSMASPQTAGAAALLLSAAEREGIDVTPNALRTALTSTADHIRGVQTYAEGAGLVDVVDAWDSLEDGASAYEYKVEAPVDTVLDGLLETPGTGTGVYDRESGPARGESETYEITLTRTSGPVRATRHELEWRGNDGTFRLLGDDDVRLRRGKPVTVEVKAKPRSAGLHSAALLVDAKRTEGIDHRVLTTVVSAREQAAPSYAYQVSNKVQRNASRSYFVRVPEGAKTLEVAMSGLRGESQTRWIAIDPLGIPADPTSTPYCYPHYDNPDNTCRPDLRSYENPTPGVWEIEVESRRTSPLLNNPFTVEATAFGADFEPGTRTIDEAKVGTPTPVEWTVTNGFAPVDGKLAGGTLGSEVSERPSIAPGETKTATIEIGEGVTRLDASIGATSDTGADLDLTVFRDGEQVAQDADADSEESVSIADPEPGTYTVEVYGYDVPAGTTEYDYRDVYFSPDLGEVSVGDEPVRLDNGESAEVAAEVTVAAPGPEGREFFGEVQVQNARGTTAGAGSVRVGKVVP
ncbi:S8 family serine peptidase [Streptomyces sp. MAR4 CNX-425]|uniref:S8 family serine peptidase n=1 Tax=Streptomyces sp. MAR4 CNX-425 TaxID=3406343 RepID=UPI003B50926A